MQRDISATLARYTHSPRAILRETCATLARYTAQPAILREMHAILARYVQVIVKSNFRMFLQHRVFVSQIFHKLSLFLLIGEKLAHTVPSVLLRFKFLASTLDVCFQMGPSSTDFTFSCLMWQSSPFGSLHL